MAICAALSQSPMTVAQTRSSDGSPIIIGHRGASGYRPEHTLASYELAIDMGADFIEPDVVATRDGVLIARHENEIGGTTDVAVKFPARRTSKTIDGKTVEGWFTEDFTLPEIKQLRARERLAFRDQSYNDRFEIPTLQDIINLAQRRSRQDGRTVGVYPETKHPSYFAAIGLPLEAALVRQLAENGYDGAASPVFIQSFEVANLKALRAITKLRLIQLMDEAAAQPYDFARTGDPRRYGDLMTPEGLAEIATYADGIGPPKRAIFGASAGGVKEMPTRLIADAHRAGLLVHVYTFRNEDRFLAPQDRGNPAGEYARFFAAGVDGVFSDFPDTAVMARKALR